LQNPIDINDSNIERLCLSSINELGITGYPMTKSSLVAIGWGYTTAGEIASEILRQVRLEVIDNNETKYNNSINNVTLQFCAAVDGGGKGK
jgi:hypothetical protein